MLGAKSCESKLAEMLQDLGRRRRRCLFIQKVFACAKRRERKGEREREREREEGRDRNLKLEPNVQIIFAKVERE